MLRYWKRGDCADEYKRTEGGLQADLFLVVISQGTGPLRGPLSRPTEQKIGSA